MVCVSNYLSGVRKKVTANKTKNKNSDDEKSTAITSPKNNSANTSELIFELGMQGMSPNMIVHISRCAKNKKFRRPFPEITKSLWKKIVEHDLIDDDVMTSFLPVLKNGIAMRNDRWRVAVSQYANGDISPMTIPLMEMSEAVRLSDDTRSEEPAISIEIKRQQLINLKKDGEIKELQAKTLQKNIDTDLSGYTTSDRLSDFKRLLDVQNNRLIKSHSTESNEDEK